MFNVSPYDDGDVQMTLMCTTCMQVKYKAFAPVREFKENFGNRKPEPKEMLTFLIGTSNIKSAMAVADKAIMPRK